MNEAFLWYLWKYRLYSSELKTTDGELVRVEHPGYQNSDSGPDFFNARIRIGETRWAGNVEVHVKSGDWYRHEHHFDRAYDNVVLHVVYESDAIIRRPDGQEIPVIELKGHYDVSRWINYQGLANSNGWVPCDKQLKGIDKLIIQQWLDRVLVSRLEKKTQFISDTLKDSKGDWSECFYQLLARSFGFKVNNLPFELTAKSLPLKIISKYKSNLFQLESLLIGQAGFLSGENEDEYIKKLQKEYIYLQKKLNLYPLERHLWKFGRLRPANFPTIRLAQFAMLIHKSAHMISKIVDAASYSEIRELFDVSAGEYWNTHYMPGKQAVHALKPIGTSSIDNIIINTIVPFLFIYGKTEGNPALSEKALKLLDDCPAEKNAIIKGWKSAGIEAFSAGHSQALLELKSVYCNEKKCLTCGIGIKLLS